MHLIFGGKTEVYVFIYIDNYIAIFKRAYSVH